MLRGRICFFWTPRPDCPTITCVTSSFEFHTYPRGSRTPTATGAEGAPRRRCAGTSVPRHVHPPYGAGSGGPSAARAGRAHRRPAGREALVAAVFGPSRRSPGSVCDSGAPGRRNVPKLLLPSPGAPYPLRIGGTRRTVCGSATRRSPGCTPNSGTREGCGSCATSLHQRPTVNGRRVIGAAVVRDGDQVGFGRWPSGCRRSSRPVPVPGRGPGCGPSPRPAGTRRFPSPRRSGPRVGPQRAGRGSAGRPPCLPPGRPPLPPMC